MHRDGNSELPGKQTDQLRWLNCYDNKLKDLDLSKNTILQNLQCRNNQIASLDLSENMDLYSLDCDENVDVTGWVNQK